MSGKHKTNMYWAVRAMLPDHGYDPIQVNNGFGYAHGYVVCSGNFANVNETRLAHYMKSSREYPHKLPIWC